MLELFWCSEGHLIWSQERNWLLREQRNYHRQAGLFLLWEIQGSFWPIILYIGEQENLSPLTIILNDSINTWHNKHRAHSPASALTRSPAMRERNADAKKEEGKSDWISEKCQETILSECVKCQMRRSRQLLKGDLWKRLCDPASHIGHCQAPGPIAGQNYV